MELQQASTIEKDYADNPAMDFAWLRKRAIELVQQYSGNTWTDYNLHDPGVTILEQLCYALTDLAYRTSVPITDLLADKNGHINHLAHSFYSREQILSSAPVSITDLRKYVVDNIYEVNNIWLEPVTTPFTKTYSRGRYKVIIQLYEKWQQQLKPGTETFEQTRLVIDKVRQVLSEVRNMGEDFESFIVLQPQKVIINAEIILFKKAVPEDMLAQIYHRLEKALNPPFIFYTEQELLAKGYSYEDIYEGPRLKGGIVPDGELKKMVTSIDPSELIKAISGMEDVLHIRRLEVGEEGKTTDVRPLELDLYHYPLLVFNPDNTDIKLYYDDQPLPVNGAVFESLLWRLREGVQRGFVEKMHDEVTTELITGHFRNTQSYTSIQHFFPAIYRLGKDGIEENETPARKAQMKQLKAYLMLFEQVLADYLAQLSHMNELYSYDVSEHNARSYFVQPLYNVPGAKDIIKAFTDSTGTRWEDFVADENNAYAQSLRRIVETDEIYRRRKRRSMEHLLSRFNVVPDPYPVMLYDFYYGSRLSKERVDEALRWKSLLLQRVKDMTYFRTIGPDYLQFGVDAEKPGFMSNMKLLLHIQNRGLYSATRAMKGIATRHDRKQEAQLAYYKSYEEDGDTLEIWIDGNMPLDSGFYIQQVPVSFLHSGAESSFYKIVPHPVASGEYLVAIKKNGGPEWLAVSRFSSRDKAAEGVRTFIDKLLQLNIQSEGFHLVEHLLLAPSHESPVFSFRFYDEKGKVLLRQREWLNWDQREGVVRQLLAALKRKVPDQEWLALIDELCTVYMPQTEGSEPVELPHILQLPEEQRRLLLGKTRFALSGFLKRKTNFYPRFKYEVQRSNKRVFTEDFYNGKVTVVFPAWPRRFQDKGFREFAETLFLNHLPAHLRPVFLWVDMYKMQRFEHLYEQWGSALSRRNEADSSFYGELLSAFLNEEHQYNLL